MLDTGQICQEKPTTPSLVSLMRSSQRECSTSSYYLCFHPGILVQGLTAAGIILQRCAPGWHEVSFAEWWRKVVKKVPKEQKKGFNTLVIVGAWLIWKHRNSCVFEGNSPSMNEVLRFFRDEHHLWCLAWSARTSGVRIGSSWSSTRIAAVLV